MLLEKFRYLFRWHVVVRQVVVEYASENGPAVSKKLEGSSVILQICQVLERIKQTGGAGCPC